MNEVRECRVRVSVGRVRNEAFLFCHLWVHIADGPLTNVPSLGPKIGTSGLVAKLWFWRSGTVESHLVFKMGSASFSLVFSCFPSLPLPTCDFLLLPCPCSHSLTQCFLCFRRSLSCAERSLALTYLVPVPCACCQAAQRLGVQQTAGHSEKWWSRACWPLKLEA